MTGSGTIGDPYIIYNVTDLQNMSLDLNAYYELANDIDASATVGWNAGAGFEPVGRLFLFTGSFHGRGFTISGLFINRPAEDYVGLFGWIQGATLSHVNITNCDITGDDYAGALVGEADESTITFCTSSGAIVANGYYAGGLVGWLTDVPGGQSIISDCSSSAVVASLLDYAGGLIGEIYADSGFAITVSRCFATGNVSAFDDYAGGFVGDIHADGPAGFGVAGSSVIITDCYATGAITFTGGVAQYGGGFAGDVSEDDAPVSITSCYATGNVTGDSYLGGFAGAYGRFGAGSITYSNCYATGNVTAVNADNIGGFLSYGEVTRSNKLTISDCYATGNVIGGANGGNGWAGGFAGWVSDMMGPPMNAKAIIERCYAIGDVSGEAWVGGFIGEAACDVIDCWATGNADGGDFVGGFAGEVDKITRNCYGTGNATARPVFAGAGSWAGGFVGIQNGTTEMCYGLGNAYAELGWAGGFAGQVMGNVSQCFSIGSAISFADYVGGFTGQTFTPGAAISRIENCYARGNAQGNDWVGGFAGYLDANSVVTNCYSIGAPIGVAANVGGFIGQNIAAAPISSFWDTQTSQTLVSDGGTGLTTAQMKDTLTFTGAGWKFITIWNRYEHCNDGYPCLYRVTPMCFVLSSVLSVSTMPATGIMDSSAVLNGVLDDNAGLICETRFQWGASSSYGTITEWKGARYKGTVFNESLAGLLSPGCLYHFRAQARSMGIVVSGRDMIFSTLVPAHMMTLLPMELAQKLG